MAIAITSVPGTFKFKEVAGNNGAIANSLTLKITGGTFAGYKLALFSLPVLASLIAFWLGLRFVPLRSTDPRGDLLNRVLADKNNLVKKIQIRILLGDYKNCFF